MRRPRDARVNPHNLDAEASILGGIFLRNSILSETAIDTLDVEDFYSPKHQAVFAAIRNLQATHVSIDPITVEVELERQGKLEAVGGLAFLGELSLRVPSVDNVVHYAEQVKALRVQVLFIQAASEILEMAYDVSDEGHLGRDGIQRAISHLMRVPTGTRDSGRTIGQLMLDELAAIERDIATADADGGRFSVGIPTGITGIDRQTGGYPIGVDSVVMGATGMGKSTLLGAGARAAANDGDLAIIYGLEDPRKFWGQRNLAHASGIPTEQIVRRRFEDSDAIRRLYAAGQEVALRRTEVFQPAAGWTMEQIVSDARARFHRLDAALGPNPRTKRRRRRSVWIDYIQVVSLLYARGVEKRTEALGLAMDHAQFLAQGCGSTDPDDEAAVIIGSQVSETVVKEKRAPTIHDWRDSAAIVNVAKYVLGVHRPGKFDPKADQRLGYVEPLKYSQGDDAVMVTCVADMATHTIYDARDVQTRFFR